MNQRDKRIRRQIEDISTDWSEDEKILLLDTIKYDGVLAEAEEFIKTKTVTYADVEDQIEERTKDFNKPSGWGTGIPAIDQMTYGLRDGEVIVLAGPSSHGKTAIALNMASKFIEMTPHKVLFISMEMTTLEIFDRVRYIVDDPKIIGNRMIVQEDRNVTAKNISSIIAANLDAKIVFIDHLHMMTRTTNARSAYDAVNEVMRTVKLLALQYSKPIVLLSHVRKQRSGPGERATAADLKDSSAIEQDADFVLMVNADQDNRDIKYITLEKSRTRKTVGEGTTMTVRTDGLKIIEYTFGAMPV